jgi:hypothetical protein
MMAREILISLSQYPLKILEVELLGIKKRFDHSLEKFLSARLHVALQLRFVASDVSFKD